MKKWIKIVYCLVLIICFQSVGCLAESNKHSLTERSRLKGHYVYGHEVNTFKPCGQKKTFWVTGPENTLRILEQKYVEYTSQPYDEVFLEISGKYIGKAKDGFAMDYDGQIFVFEMFQMQKKSENDCK